MISLLSFLFLTILCVVNSQVPPNATFTFTNRGEFADFLGEYNANYRDTSLHTFPFTLTFYNATPGAYVLAVRAGTPLDITRFVWDANRANPVGENATLTLRPDGNLVLAESDGRIAWQTNTANRGVTDINLLENGNLVLTDTDGRFVWQSFDHPVDSLLIGMSLTFNGSRLISRRSDTDGSNGPYSLVLEDPGVVMYLNNSGQLIRYADFSGYNGNTRVRFITEQTEVANNTIFQLILVLQPQSPPQPYNIIIARNKYNATYSFLRLGIDGSVKVFTYYSGWEETFSYFRDYSVRECGLPARCGQFGLCDNGMCVGCPTRRGVLGWSEACAPPQLERCGGGGGGDQVGYYRVVGAEHFLTLLTSGEAITVRECRERCSRDCECKGFVYQEDISICLRVPVLATLIRSVNTSVVYVKY